MAEPTMSELSERLARSAGIILPREDAKEIAAALREAETEIARLKVRGDDECQRADHNLSRAERAEAALAEMAAALAHSRELALFDALAHGDSEHRRWLKEAISAFFAGEPIPEARQAVSREEIITALQNLTTDEGPDQAQLEKARDILAALDQAANKEREG